MYCMIMFYETLDRTNVICKEKGRLVVTWGCKLEKLTGKRYKVTLWGNENVLDIPWLMIMQLYIFVKVHQTVSLKCMCFKWRVM